MLGEFFDYDVAVIGGCGHVGLPLAIAFAQRGCQVVIQDIDATAVELVNAGRMPFFEPGASQALDAALSAGRLVATTEAVHVTRAENVVVVIGTPVDEHLSPDPGAIPRALARLGNLFVDGQLLVLRSTVYPGVTSMVEKLIVGVGRDVDVAFCPERIAEGAAMRELSTLPQIVASRTVRGRMRASWLFRLLTDVVVELSPEEAELAKLFTNTWRYIRFAAANQLYMMANDRGLDFERIRSALMTDYPRAADMPGPGFAAGPCLLKDTMQLAACNGNNFPLGHAAMQVNEGLPIYLVERLERMFDLSAMTVGVLGMAFKAGSDDIRASLSYKLRRLLRYRAARVLCTDPHVSVDQDLVPLAEVLADADLLVIGAPHPEYRDLSTEVPVIDVWNLTGRGVQV